jgi:hypothetical protein
MRACYFLPLNIPTITGYPTASKYYYLYPTISGNTLLRNSQYHIATRAFLQLNS